MFTILCCADLHGEKVNLEVTLQEAPVSVQDVIASLTHTFVREEAAMVSQPQPTYHTFSPTFQIASVFIYDDVLLRWSKLKSITQLHEYDQLYLFQPQTQWHRDTQQDLPPPRPPMQSRATSLACGTPLPPAAVTESGATTPGRYTAASDRAGLPSATFQRSAAPAAAPPPRTPGANAASDRSEASRVVTRSPVRQQLAEQRQEEERLAQRLSSVRDERERLERAAQREEAEERRRRAAELDVLMQRTEQAIWAHREALSKAEEDYQRLLSERQRLVGSVSPH